MLLVAYEVYMGHATLKKYRWVRLVARGSPIQVFAPAYMKQNSTRRPTCSAATQRGMGDSFLFTADLVN